MVKNSQQVKILVRTPTTVQYLEDPETGLSTPDPQEACVLTNAQADTYIFFAKEEFARNGAQLIKIIWNKASG